MLDVRRDKREREAYAELERDTENNKREEEAAHAFAEGSFDFEAAGSDESFDEPEIDAE